jgi:hypothetical protein
MTAPVYQISRKSTDRFKSYYWGTQTHTGRQVGRQAMQAGTYAGRQAGTHARSQARPQAGTHTHAGRQARTQAGRQAGDLISPLSFFECRLKNVSYKSSYKHIDAVENDDAVVAKHT